MGLSWPAADTVLTEGNLCVLCVRSDHAVVWGSCVSTGTGSVFIFTVESEFLVLLLSHFFWLSKPNSQAGLSEGLVPITLT